MFPSVKYMGYERVYIQFACGNKCTEFFHAETSARHETAVDLFVSHADTPFSARDIDIGAASKIVDITDLSCLVLML